MSSTKPCTTGDGSTTSAPAGTPLLKLQIIHLGNVPSFKTGKRGTWGRTKEGKLYARPITKREHRDWMKKAIGNIASQLLYALARERVTTQTAPLQPSSTASPGPVERFVETFDDNCRQVRSFSVDCSIAGWDDGSPEGLDDTGADITIEILWPKL